MISSNENNVYTNLAFHRSLPNLQITIPSSTPVPNPPLIVNKFHAFLHFVELVRLIFYLSFPCKETNMSSTIVFVFRVERNKSKKKYKEVEQKQEINYKLPRDDSPVTTLSVITSFLLKQHVTCRRHFKSFDFILGFRSSFFQLEDYHRRKSREKPSR